MWSIGAPTKSNREAAGRSPRRIGAQDRIKELAHPRGNRARARSSRFQNLMQARTEISRLRRIHNLIRFGLILVGTFVDRTKET